MKLNIKHVSQISLLALISVLGQSASANTNWSNQPSWAASSSERNTRSAGRKDGNPDLSPFAPGSNNFSLDVGQVFLMGQLAEKYADNLGFQMHYTYGVSDMFGFDSSLGYSQHSDGQYSMTTLLSGLRTNLAWYDKVIPHAIFGLGFYKPSIRMENSRNSLSPVLFGIHMGGGVDLLLTQQLFFGASLTFHDIFGAERRTPNGAIDVGGTYTSFLMRAGYSF